MNVTATTNSIGTDGLDFGELFARLGRRWYMPVLGVILTVILASLYLGSATYHYTATMRVAPTQSNQQNGVGSKLGRLNSLASVAGVNLGAGSGALDFDLYVESFQSRDVADLLATDQGLMHVLYPREWDQAAHLWREPSSFVHDVAVKVKQLLGIPSYPYQRPDGARVLILLQRGLVVDRSLRTPVVTVSFDDENPDAAVRLLRRTNATIDGLLRHRALVRSNEAIRFLENNLRTVQLVEQRTAIADLLSNQIQTRMSATSSQPFAAEVFEQPAASFRPTSPQPPRTLLVSALAGLAGGIALAVAWGPSWRSLDLGKAKPL